MRSPIPAVVLATMLVAIGQPLAAQEELITNGGFESGFAGWTTQTWPGSDGVLVIHGGGPGPESGVDMPAPYSGSRYALTDQDGPGAYALSQVFSVSRAPTSATLVFAMFLNNFAPRTVIGPDFDPFGGDPNQYVSVDLFFGALGGFSTATPLQNFFKGSVLATDETSNPWVLYTYDVTSLLSAPGTYTLRFAEVDNGDVHNLGVDGVSLLATTSTVPEPFSMALLGTGLAGLAAVRRRKKREAEEV